MAVLDQLPPALENKSAGTTRVVAVRPELRKDSEGEQALFVTLVLEDPTGTEDGTWPIDDLWALQDDVQQAIKEVAPDLDIRWYVVFQPQTEDELGPDDESIAGY